MEFAIGFCGALACLAVFGLGAAAGWFAARPGRGIPGRRDSPEGVADADALRRARDELDAFRRLQNYTVGDAYGENQEG